jgi:ABC-type antimicrobial peptide transport system permease subunit
MPKTNLKKFDYFVSISRYTANKVIGLMHKRESKKIKGSMLSLAWKNISRRKIRSLLAILGIAFSIALLVSVITISDGIRQSVSKPLVSAGADMVIQKHGEPCAYRTVKLPTDINPMPEKAISQIKEYEEVDKITGVLELWAFHNGKPTVVDGLDPEIKTIGPIKPSTEKGACCEITDGRYLSKDDNGKNVAVVDKDFAQITNLQVGSKLPLGDTEFKVIGTINIGKMARIAGAQVFIPLSTAQEMVGEGEIIDNIFIKLKGKADPEKVKEKIKSILGKNVSITTSSDLLATVAGLSFLTKEMTLGISILVIVFALLFIVKSSISAVNERIREIGIIKAIGWKDKDVKELITTENAIQGVIGGIIGCGAGYFISWLYAVTSHLSIPKALTPYPACSSTLAPNDLAVSIDFSFLTFVIGLVAAICIGSLAGYISARRATSLQPVEALRHI